MQGGIGRCDPTCVGHITLTALSQCWENVMLLLWCQIGVRGVEALGGLDKISSRIRPQSQLEGHQGCEVLPWRLSLYILLLSSHEQAHLLVQKPFHYNQSASSCPSGASTSAVAWVAGRTGGVPFPHPLLPLVLLW